MLGQRLNKNNEAQENIFWMTMTDLLLGLAVIFIVLFVLAMTGYSSKKIEEQQVKADVAEDLVKELQSKNIAAQVDTLTGDVKLSDLQLFKTGSYELSPEGKEFLNKFVPIYLDSIFTNPKASDSVESIVVQGHTDSQSFAGIDSKDMQFVKNMELSTQRANEVAKYIFYTRYNKKYSKKLHELLIVEGKSWSEPVLVNGKEDFAKSRRVELKINVKGTDLQEFMGLAKK